MQRGSNTDKEKDRAKLVTKKVAILISGTGSNMQSLVEAVNHGELIPPGSAEISLVLSNNADAAGIDFARSQNIKTAVLDHRAFETRDAFDTALLAELTEVADIVLLAGFMRILGNAVVSHFRGKMLNIHPSLLPLYPGLETHQRALNAGDTVSGASVHFVTPELDGGPVILQASVPIEPDDTVETLASRVLSNEHKIYPLALKWLLDGSIRLMPPQMRQQNEEYCEYLGSPLAKPLLLADVAHT